jgi:CheY-like chemotaxis protein/Tfp pilus assembly protein PilZ
MTVREKRSQTRLPLEVRVQVIRGDYMRTHLCSDISAGGLFVRTDEKWRNAEQVQVRVFLPGVVAPLLLGGEVVRVIEGNTGGIGIRFVESNRELRKFCESRSSEVLERSQRKILIAHGKEDMRYFLRSVLAVEGYRVTEAATLDDVRNAVEHDTYDLWVVDPLLSNGDGGLMLGEWLQINRTAAHVVMVTEGEVVGEAPFHGGDYALVTEPVELAAFRHLVWNLVK